MSKRDSLLQIVDRHPGRTKFPSAGLGGTFNDYLDMVIANPRVGAECVAARL